MVVAVSLVPFVSVKVIHAAVVLPDYFHSTKKGLPVMLLTCTGSCCGRSSCSAMHGVSQMGLYRSRVVVCHQQSPVPEDSCGGVLIVEGEARMGYIPLLILPVEASAVSAGCRVKAL